MESTNSQKPTVASQSGSAQPQQIPQSMGVPAMQQMPQPMQPGMPLMQQMPMQPGMPFMQQMPMQPGMPPMQPGMPPQFMGASAMPQMPMQPGMPLMQQMPMQPGMQLGMNPFAQPMSHPGYPGLGGHGLQPQMPQFMGVPNAPGMPQFYPPAFARPQQYANSSIPQQLFGSSFVGPGFAPVQYRGASLKSTGVVFQESQSFDDDEALEVKVVAEQRAIVAEDKLELTAKCALSPVQLSAVAQEVPCMISLHGVCKNLEEIESSRSGLDLVCVIDISGSMGGIKIDLVRDTLEFLVSKLTPSDRLSLVVFDNFAFRVCPLLVCTSAGRATLEEYVGRLGAEGGTNMVQGLECGLKVLADRRVVNTITSLFLLSDGVDNNVSTALERSQEVMTRYRQRIRGDFTVHTFGYGSDHDSNIMCNVADQGFGAFHFVEKVESIAEAFADSFGGLVSQVAKNVEVHLEAVQGALPCRVSKMYTKTGADLFALPAVMANESKDFVFILEVGPGALEAAVTFPAVIAEARYSTVAGQAVTERIELSIECVPASAQATLNVREDVLVNFYRVKGAEILKEASVLAEQRHFDQSRQCLQRGIEELRASLVASHLLVATLIKDLEDAKNRVRDESAWQMGGAAQVKSAFSNHYGQAASSNTQFYAQPQQAAYNMQFQAYQNQKRP